MAWTAPRTWVAGETVTAALLNTHLRDNLKALGDPWATWTPALTATTTNPTLGTGSSATGRYVSVGKTTIAQFRIIFGTSGVVVGSGTYLISLPVAPAASVSNQLVGIGQCVDASANGLGPTWLRVNGTASQVVMSFPATWPGGALTNVTHVNLFAWAASDEIWGQAIYEAA